MDLITLQKLFYDSVNELTNKYLKNVTEIINKEKSNHPHEFSLIKEEDAAKILGIGKRTLQAWRGKKSNGPDFIKISNRCVRYREEDIHKWASKLSVKGKS